MQVVTDSELAQDDDVVDIEDADEQETAAGKASRAGVTPDQAAATDLNGHVSSSGW